MTNVLRWFVVSVLVAHGLIHLLRVVKGLGWADVAQLKPPIGTAGSVNVLLVLAAVYGFASQGPTSFHGQFRDRAGKGLADAPATPGATALVTEQDLAGLPEPLAEYVRRSGAVGKPRVTSFSAEFHGRIRSGPGQPWMSFTGEQLNTFAARPQRVFIMGCDAVGTSGHRPALVREHHRDHARQGPVPVHGRQRLRTRDGSR